MKATLLLCSLFFFGSLVSAQSNDFILLKKKGKTVRRLFAGQYITAAIEGNGPYDLLIRNVYNDSVRFMGYALAQNATGYGGFYIDTVERYYITKPYRSFTAFYNDKNKKFNFASSSGTLMAAGFLGLLMTGVNAAYLKQPVFTGGTPWFAAGSAALIGVGYLLFKTSTKPIKIGKKYQLVYVKVDS
jgi:hypothetical protein